MGKPTGFMEYGRENQQARPVEERLADYEDVYRFLPEDRLRTQAARCMDCGVPFCQGAGCPVANIIPEFNDLVYRGQWHEAVEVLHSTNNFPEFTGHVCPAPCESSCVSAIHGEAVSIRQIELQIVEKGFEQGWIKPLPPKVRTGKSVVVVGSGPAGLACAQQLGRAGHEVIVYEQKDRLGGLLRYGIPDFKLDKGILDRRLRLIQAEGIDFRTGVHIGRDISASYLLRKYDAICLAGGAMQPRGLAVPGRDLDGIHFAMSFLEQSNRLVAGKNVETIPEEERIWAGGRKVVVIGGGDTGADCVGTANRQGAISVTQLEILPRPPESRNPDTPWPQWPQIMRTSSSHEEGCERRWSVMTKSFGGSRGRVEKLQAVEVSFAATGPAGQGGGRIIETPGTGFEIETDLVLLAMGFLHPVHEGMIEDLGVELDEHGNVRVDKNCMTSVEGVFSAGDMALGASLVVRAIAQGRAAARAIDTFLMGETCLT
ncbi:MAG: glutamate synthase subunit beta [Gemmatimonadota bacterium]|nr:glutamate synthase subunit beta [Gemmatimonadota bacterium]